MQVTNFGLRYGLYKIVIAGFQLFDAGRQHPVRERSLRALNRSVDYIEAHMPQAMGFDTQKELLTYSLEAVNVPGYYMEFGVYTGGTLRYMARRKPQQQFHGFDSFEGLPERWSGSWLGKNAFSLGGKPPKMPGNVTLHQGWFRESLLPWKESHSDKVAFMHIDCDLYSSTVDVLENLADRMQAGTIITFDEYFNYPNWENHEFKAWKDFVAKYHVEYEYLGFARHQVTLRIINIGTAR